MSNPNVHLSQLTAECGELIRPALEAVGDERWGSQGWLLLKQRHYRLEEDKNLLNSLTEPETYREDFLPLRWLLLGELVEKKAERELFQPTGRKVGYGREHRFESGRWALERATWQGYMVLVATAPRPRFVVNDKEYSALRTEDLQAALLRTLPMHIHVLTKQYETRMDE